MLKSTYNIIIITGLFLVFTQKTNAQEQTDKTKHKKYQATPPPPQKFGAEAFEKSDKTVI